MKTQVRIIISKITWLIGPGAYDSKMNQSFKADER